MAMMMLMMQQHLGARASTDEGAFLCTCERVCVCWRDDRRAFVP